MKGNKMLNRNCARCGVDFVIPAGVYANDWSNPATTQCNDCRVSIAHAFMKALGQVAK